MNASVTKALKQEQALRGRGHKASLAQKLDIGVSTMWKYIEGLGVSEIMEAKIIIGCEVLLEQPEIKKVSQSMRADWYLKNAKV